MPEPATLRRRRCGVLAGLALVAAGAVAGCGDDANPSSARPTDPPTTTAPATTLTPEQADEAALRQLTEDWFEARSRVLHDGANPSLAGEFIAGEYLERFLQEVDEFRASDQHLERGARSREVIDAVQVAGDEATVTTCFVDADALFAADGSLVDDGVGTTRWSTTAHATQLGWRFASRTNTSSEEGDHCAG